ncbi:hypothetical protein PAHAL_9G018400 [Panicum hallii]|uniref:J domain-containing protein n=1 Tax=Panicum hallii TaxID=206008 RepID=A0A2T8HZT7_9POAL|nr:uncharacterized protein LOC112877876 [Panicum hallii]PVH30940.1 hypothetical protein PAHAL_9G018400 [Panicum hallii]
MARYEYEREQAEKACRYAEELFLAGNIPGAHRHASRAKRLCPSLPGVANALAVYEAHAAAGGSWRAVLGIQTGAAATQDAIKKQYRRLSLLVHPDKARCAAAEGAFKLVRRACEEALSSAASSRDTSPPQVPRAAAQPNVRRAAAPPPPMMQPMYYAPRVLMRVYCSSCKNEYAAKIGRLEQQGGMKCARCPEWLSPPCQKKPPASKEPTAVPGRQVFQCPAKCPECGAAYTSKVCVGRWCLRCKACTKSSMVDVQGPEQATAKIRKRA